MRLKDTIKKARKYLAVLYTEEGVFEEYLFLPSNLNLIMMDTEIIAKFSGQTECGKSNSRKLYRNRKGQSKPLHWKGGLPWPFTD